MNNVDNIFIANIFNSEKIHKQKNAYLHVFLLCSKWFVIAVDIYRSVYKWLQTNTSFLTKFDKDNLTLILEVFVISKVDRDYFTLLWIILESFIKQCNCLEMEMLYNCRNLRQNLSWQTALSAGWNVARSLCPSCLLFTERIIPGILDCGQKHELLIWKSTCVSVMPLTLCFGIRSWWKVRKTWRFILIKRFQALSFPWYLVKYISKCLFN